MLKYFLSALIGAILTVAVELAFVCLGGISMDTKSKPFPLEKFLAHRALDSSIGKHAADPSPIPADESTLQAGAKIYNKSCSICHGELDRPAPPFARGEYPPPPQLLPPQKGVSDDEVGETFWKVKYGIRLTGMPGFSDSLTENEMWQVSLFLSKSDKLPPSVLESLKSPLPESK